MSFILFFVVFILILLIAIVSFGISLVRGVISLVFPSLFRRNSTSSYGANESSDKDENQGESIRRKIFDRNDGEYTEFEEVD